MGSETTKVLLAGVLLVASVAATVFALRGCRPESYRPPARGVEHWERKAKHAGEVRTRCVAVQELSKSPAPQAVPVLLETLTDKSAPVAAASARALGERRERRAVVPLTKQLERKSTIVKFATIKALQDIGDPRALEGLKSQVTRENALAADAAWAIGRLKDPRTGRLPKQAEDTLIKFLASPIPKIRLGAIYGLRDGGTAQALPALRKLARDPFDGILPEILARPVPEMGKPKPILLGGPCREAIRAIEARTSKKRPAS
jgi:hypothetical protein